MTRAFPQLRVMGREEAEAHRPDGPDEVCISILGPESRADLSRDFCDVLRLGFHDLAGYPEPHPAGAVQIDDAMADAVIDFAERHRTARVMVVHCAAGISRSASVAQALATCYTRTWFAPRWHGPERIHARYVHNRAVFEAVREAYLRRHPAEADRLDAQRAPTFHREFEQEAAS